MYFLNDYKHYIFNIHFSEKIPFFRDVKKDTSLSQFELHFKIFDDIHNEKVHSGLTLLSVLQFNTYLKYSHYSNNRYICYSLKIKEMESTDFYKWNSFYFFIIHMNSFHYNHLYYIQDSSFSKSKIVFFNFSNNLVNHYFNDITGGNMTIHMFFQMNSLIAHSSYYSRLWLSHNCINV